MSNGWGGRRAQAWTRAVLFRYGTECHLKRPGCTGTATTGDHLIPRSVRPDLQYSVENGRPACLSCNSGRGAGPVQQGGGRAPLSPRFAQRQAALGAVVDNREWFAGQVVDRRHLFEAADARGAQARQVADEAAASEGEDEGDDADAARPQRAQLYGHGVDAALPSQETGGTASLSPRFAARRPLIDSPGEDVAP